MIALVTQEEIQNRMGTGWVPQAEPIFTSAIMAATKRIEAELDTKLDLKSNVDTFLLDWTKLRVIPDGFFRLRLKNGFVRSTPTVTVLCGETASSITEVVEGYTVWEDRGYVFVPEDYSDHYVQVSYDSGFALGDDGAIDRDVPEALKEAILGYVPAVIDFSSTTDAGKAVSRESAKVAVEHALSVLVPLRRHLGLTLNPAF